MEGVDIGHPSEEELFEKGPALPLTGVRHSNVFRGVQRVPGVK